MPIFIAPPTFYHTLCCKVIMKDREYGCVLSRKSNFPTLSAPICLERLKGLCKFLQ